MRPPHASQIRQTVRPETTALVWDRLDGATGAVVLCVTVFGASPSAVFGFPKCRASAMPLAATIGSLSAFIGKAWAAPRRGKMTYCCEGRVAICHLELSLLNLHKMFICDEIQKHDVVGEISKSLVAEKIRNKPRVAAGRDYANG